MHIETYLGDKGLYIEDCVDQDSISYLFNLEKTLNRQKIDQLHFFRSGIPNRKDQIGIYLQSNIDAAILEYISKSGKDKSEYILRTSYSLSEWKLGKSLAAHIDSIKYDHEDTHTPRSIINCLLYLTDDYEGGEIFFPEVDISIKPKAGSVVVFDSDLMHGVAAVKSGIRKTLSSNLYSIYAEDIDEVKALGWRYLGQ